MESINIKEKCLDLMEQKHQALKQMLDLTEKTVFTGEQANAEKEVEAFVALYDRRSNILARIEKIDDALGLVEPLDAADMEDFDFQERVIALRTQTMETVREMVRLDKQNVLVYEKLSEFLKGSMRHVKQSKDINSRYFDDFEGAEGGFLDKSN